MCRHVVKGHDYRVSILAHVDRKRSLLSFGPLGQPAARAPDGSTCVFQHIDWPPYLMLRPGVEGGEDEVDEADELGGEDSENSEDENAEEPIWDW